MRGVASEANCNGCVFGRHVCLDESTRTEVMPNKCRAALNDLQRFFMHPNRIIRQYFSVFRTNVRETDELIIWIIGLEMTPLIIFNV